MKIFLTPDEIKVFLKMYAIFRMNYWAIVRFTKQCFSFPMTKASWRIPFLGTLIALIFGLSTDLILIICVTILFPLFCLLFLLRTLSFISWVIKNRVNF
jgi:hypothetical protein